jgi:WD repeat and FYVE domain-containing protein 3
MRLEPFSRLALSLQGGRFDVADRLFHDVGRSWRSASCENLQDVRELIPEFYYLPDFLVNTNHFDFGETQRGKTVHDVTLPRWAKDDPKRFVRINRQALESEYVSKNLHLWLDLVFGHKQRGDEAIACLNTFVHVTYEGEVDIDSMTNPVQRQSTIAQIQNFGQTPSRLERRPFPQRTLVSIVKENAIDFSSVAALTNLTPPLCVVGAPSRIRLSHVKTEQCRIGRVGVSDTAVGEISYSKGQLLAVPKLCALAIPMKKYFSFGGVNNGVTVLAAAITARFREVNKLLSIHDDMHRAPIVAAKASLNGDWLVTGSVDSTIRVWFYDGTQLHLQATFCGHDGSRITCIDVSVECGVIVSGCSHGRVLLWDLRTLTFVRALQTKCDKATLSASINHKNGNVVALVDDKVLTFDINGTLVAERQFSSANPPTCAAATDCPEWMEEGIAVVTGHHSGEVRLFSIDYDQQELVHRHTVESNPHTSAITALRVTGAERQDTLLVGDASGSVSVFNCAQLDSFTMAELDVIAKEITTARNAYLFKNGEKD